MSIEAMKQALEALEENHHLIEEHEHPDYLTLYDRRIHALRTAIEQAEKQEPVANASAWFALVMNAAAELEDASHCLRDEDAKRVAISGAKHYRDAAKTLYATPPAAQRQWVGLTDEEVDALDCVKVMWQDYESCEIHGVKEFYRAVEAKLREKNTGESE